MGSPNPAGAQQPQQPQTQYPHLTPIRPGGDILPTLRPSGSSDPLVKKAMEIRLRDQMEWYQERASKILNYATIVASQALDHDLQEIAQQQVQIHRNVTIVRSLSATPPPTQHPSPGQPTSDNNRTVSGPQQQHHPQVLRPRDISKELQDNNRTTCTIRPPPVRGASLAGGIQATQYLQFMAAMRKIGGEYILETPFDMGTGTAKVTPHDAKHASGWPGQWPSPNHNRFEIRYHFSTWLHAVCKWARTATADPEQTLAHAINHIMQIQDQEAIKTHMLGTPTTVSRVDALYDAVMTVAHGHQDPPLHPTYSAMLPRVITGQIGDQETVLEYYARFLHNISLLFNAVDYQVDSPLDGTQLKACFISAIAPRPLRDSPMIHELPAHPREQYHLYELWNLAWTNQQYSVGPPETALQQAMWRPQQQQQHAPAVRANYLATKPTKRPSPEPPVNRPEKRPHVEQPGKSTWPTHPNRNIHYQPPQQQQQQQPSRYPGPPNSANLTPLGGGLSTPPQRPGVQEILDPNIPPYRELPKALHDAIQVWRASVFGKNKKLDIATLQEVPEARAAAAEIGRVASSTNNHYAICWCCKRWGHLTTSPLCPFKRT